jgi:hypothetical protein
MYIEASFFISAWPQIVRLSKYKQTFLALLIVSLVIIYNFLSILLNWYNTMPKTLSYILQVVSYGTYTMEKITIFRFFPYCSRNKNDGICIYTSLHAISHPSWFRSKIHNFQRDNWMGLIFTQATQQSDAMKEELVVK